MDFVLYLDDLLEFLLFLSLFLNLLFLLALLLDLKAGLFIFILNFEFFELVDYLFLVSISFLEVGHEVAIVDFELLVVIE